MIQPWYDWHPPSERFGPSKWISAFENRFDWTLGATFILPCELILHHVLPREWCAVPDAHVPLRPQAYITLPPGPGPVTKSNRPRSMLFFAFETSFVTLEFFVPKQTLPRTTAPTKGARSDIVKRVDYSRLLDVCFVRRCCRRRRAMSHDQRER